MSGSLDDDPKATGPQDDPRTGESRDDELGRVLSRAGAPDHRPGYWETVERLVVPEMTQEAVRVAVQPEARRRRRFGGRRLRLAVAAAAAAATALGLVLIGLPGETNVTGPSQATAARRMLAAMDSGMSRAQALKAVVTYSWQYNPPVSGQRSLEVWRGGLLAAASGGVRLDLRPVRNQSGSPGGRSLALYDPRTHTRVLASWRDGQSYGIRWKRSWPTSRMDEGAARSWQQWVAQAAFVKAALAEDSAVAVKEGTYQGRAAWIASISAGQLWPTATYSPTTGPPMTVAVDKQTGLLLHSVFVTPEVREELSLSRVRTDVRPSNESFTRLPKGLHPRVWATEWTSAQGRTVRVESYNHFASLGTVGEKAGFDPLIPTPAPSGYSPTDIASLAEEPSSGPAAWLPESVRWGVRAPRPGTPDNEIDMLYRRGFDWFQVLQTSLASSESSLGPSPSPEAHSLTSFLSQIRTYPFLKTATLTSGALEGAPAWTWLSLTTGPGLAVVGKGYALMITGSLTRSELIAVANSLAPYSRTP